MVLTTADAVTLLGAHLGDFLAISSDEIRSGLSTVAIAPVAANDSSTRPADQSMRLVVMSMVGTADRSVAVPVDDAQVVPRAARRCAVWPTNRSIHGSVLESRPITRWWLYSLAAGRVTVPRDSR